MNSKQQKFILEGTECPFCGSRLLHHIVHRELAGQVKVIQDFECNLKIISHGRFVSHNQIMTSESLTYDLNPASFYSMKAQEMCNKRSSVMEVALR